MHVDASDLDTETLERAERECLERPSDSAMWDERLYVTHGPVIGWAERGDDLLAESNYLMVLQALQAEAAWTEHEDRDCCWTEDGAKIGHGTDTYPHDDDVIDATIGDWLVGSLRQVFVRVREEFCETCGILQEDGEWPTVWPLDADGEDLDESAGGHWHQGAFTRTFRAAVAIGLALQDYPVFDESDFSERETEAFDKNLASALESAEHADDDEELSTAVREALYEDEGAREDIYQGGYPDVDWELVQTLWDEKRAAILSERADLAERAWSDYARELSNPQEETLPLQVA